MNKSQLRRYEMLVRVRDFGVAQAKLFPKPSLAQETFKTVADAVEQLSAHTVTKLTSVQGTSTKAKARTALIDRLEAICQTGRVVAEHTSGLADKFVMPIDPPDQALVLFARAVASTAATVKDQFTAHLMPKAFLTELEQLTASFEQSLQDRQSAKDQRLASRTKTEEALATGIAAAKALDAMVRNQLRGDAAMLAVWERDRRIIWPSHPRAKGETPASEPVAPAAAPVVAPPEPATPEPAVTPPAPPSTEATNTKAA